ncbi:winged helix-turn-helix domain-containing protein [Tessaracoccus sp. G1721]
MVIPPDNFPSPLGQSLWAFSQRGVDVEVHFDGASALIAVGEGDVSVVVVPLSLPGVEITRFISAVKGYAGVPVLVGLSGDPDPGLVVAALDAGAQGLISFPLSSSELCDHLRAIGVSGPGRVVTGASAALHPEASALKLGDHVVTLSPKDFQLLELLVRNSPQTVPTDALQAVLGSSRVDAVVAVRVAIGRLRRRLLAHGVEADDAVQSVRGVGYRWVDPTPLS